MNVVRSRDDLKLDRLERLERLVEAILDDMQALAELLPEHEGWDTCPCPLCQVRRQQLAVVDHYRGLQR